MAGIVHNQLLHWTSEHPSREDEINIAYTSEHIGFDANGQVRIVDFTKATSNHHAIFRVPAELARSREEGRVVLSYHSCSFEKETPEVRGSQLVGSGGCYEMEALKAWHTLFLSPRSRNRQNYLLKARDSLRLLHFSANHSLDEIFHPNAQMEEELSNRSLIKNVPPNVRPGHSQSQD